MANAASHARTTILALVTIAGCGGQAMPDASVAPSPTPVASQPAPTPAATPSPTPDLAQRVLRRLKTDPAVTWAILGSETVPSSLTVYDSAGSPVPMDLTIDSPDIVINYKGILITVGADYFLRLEPLEGNPAVVEALQRRGETLWRFGGQRWEPSKSTARLADVIRSIGSLTPDGSAEQDGQTLRRFRVTLSEPIQLDMLWHVNATRGEPDAGELVVLASDDGTPKTLLVTITSDDFTIPVPDFPNGPPRTYQFEFRRASPTGGFAVPDASPTLSMTPVKQYALAIGLPNNWSLEGTEDDWVWYQSDVTWGYIGIARIPVPKGAAGDSVRQQTRDWTQSWTKGVRDAVGVEPAAVELVRVGPATEGLLTTWVVPARGSNRAFLRIDATFVHGGWAYAVRWESDPKGELTDRYLFERVLETVDLDG